ncbi:hypothetical protein [Spiroplasma endosymbiont of Othius punctulatus]|uniref:hypothetical protein n=1 Tax=Spiroplasma endosymbiont of Othius punctulatus TaxID=3066289 RepID=UPI0030D07E85
MANNIIKTILQKNDEFKFKNNSNVICIGNFDGLHPIHQKVIYKTKEIAADLGYSFSIFTFEKKINPLKDTFNIFSNELKNEKICAQFNPDYIFELKINDATIATTANDFLDYLKNNLCVKKIVVGSDIKFGHKAQGNSGLLVEIFGKENVIIFEREAKISTTKAKEYLISSKFEKFKSVMGYNFRVEVLNENKKYKLISSGFKVKNGLYKVAINNVEYDVEIINYVVNIQLDKEIQFLEIIKLIKEI